MICLFCNKNKFLNNIYYYTCLNCGIIINNFCNEEEDNNNKKYDDEYIKKKIIYKRVWYLKELLYNINLIYVNYNINYNEIIIFRHST